jgi:diguanylate cyclase (GGDEF)-like protein/PAS domain S-box-containing protein
MTARGHDSKATPVRPPRSQLESRRERAQLARKWAHQVATTTYIPLPYQDIEAELLLLVDKLFDALRVDPFTPEPAAEVAERLVAMNCVGPTSFARTLDILGKALLGQAELRMVTGLPEKVVALLGTLSATYVEGVRLLTLRQQDDLNRTLVMLGRDSRQALLATEARMDALLAHATVGIGVTDSDGRFLTSNPTLTGLLGYAPIELAQQTLFDLLPAGDEMFVRDACAGLQAGFLPRLRQRRRLVGKSGDEVPVTLTMSVLREPDQPERFLVMVQDDSELNLLQRQLTRQSLHDVLTALPNRQFFTTRLETTLHRAHRDTGATIYHLGLDSFAMIADGLGRQAGDQVLKAVADRLQVLMAQEKAVVARLDSDEFGILVENSPTTPDVATMVDRINRALGEPIPVDGHTVTVSAGVGVVHRPRRDLDPTELLRASDQVLRRAKARGRRQWELFDARRDADERTDLTTAVTMASAWESGEIQIRWRPRVDLRGGRVSGVEASLRWDHPRLGLLDHTRCVTLAERTGLMLSLGDWLLHSACTRFQQWRGESAFDLPLIVALSEGQAVDPDLADRVMNVLSATGVEAGRLSLGVPARVLRDDRPEPVDNLRVVTDEGVDVALFGFGAAGDVVALEELPVRSVRLDDRLTVGRACRAKTRAAAGKPSLLDRALTDLVAIAHEAGASVMVDGVDTAAHADWWRYAGADMAMGEAFPFAGESTLHGAELPVHGESAP